MHGLNAKGLLPDIVFRTKEQFEDELNSESRGFTWWSPF